ncbi:MAG: PQQ-dependent dehydrogenase, methanol/ethanol family [Steroidobacteraceae bacterium]
MSLTRRLSSRRPHGSRRKPLFAVTAVCVLLGACGRPAQNPPAASSPARSYGQIDAARLANAAQEPDQWLATGRDPQGTYHSPLKAINEGNVARLGFAWEHRLGTTRGLEATPVVVDGVMYAVGNWGIVYALDAASGEELWVYDPRIDGQWWGRYACCDVVNRGVVVANGKVYVGSLDGYLHAIDARTGKRVWRADTLLDRGPKAFHYFISGAPVLAGDLVIIGNGGSDFPGARGFITAVDAASGEVKWRFYSAPRDPRLGPQDQPHLEKALSTWPKQYDWSYGGGGSAWDGITYDAGSRLLYIGTAHAAPYRIELRDKGGSDQLYTAAIIAIHADSGQYAWHYQATPGDGWDYDATAKLTLADIEFGGRPRKVVFQANKNGYFYVLDRVTGEFLAAWPFAYMNWNKGLDPRSHRPIYSAAANWHESPKLVFPPAPGAHGWQPMSYSPDTGLVYIPVLDAAMVYVDLANRRMQSIEGNFQLAFFFPEDYDPKALEGLFGKLPELSALAKDSAVPPRSRGFLRALDPRTGRIVWEQPGANLWDGGVLSTAGNLVFRGDSMGELNVYAANDGRLLKKIDTGTSIMAAPMTYRIGGTQYVSVMAGFGGGVLFMPFPADSAAYQRGNAGRILTFKLDGGATPIPPAFVEAPFPEPPAREGTPAQIAQGELLYNRFCSRCHAFGRGLLPDLRRIAPATHQMFYDIVLKGIYQPKGMARWDDVLSRADAESIHAFLIDQAWQAYPAAAHH